MKKIRRWYTGIYALCLTVLLALLLGSCTSTVESDEAPAFGESYDEACRAIGTAAGDAKLFAVQTSSLVFEDEQPTWMYLFGSQEKGYLYSVFLNDGKASVADYGPIALTEKEWDSIPDLSSMPIGSSEAYEKARVEFQKSQPVENYSMYLIAFLSNDGDGTDQAKKWEIIFNADSNDSDTTVSGTCYTVDAETGDLARKVLNEDPE